MTRLLGIGIWNSQLGRISVIQLLWLKYLINSKWIFLSRVLCLKIPHPPCKQWVLCWIHLLLKHPSLQLVFWILHYLFSWHTKYKPVITCKVGAQNNVFCIFSAELHAEFSTHCKPAFVIQDKHKTLFFIVLTAAAAFEYKYKKRSDETDHSHGQSQSTQGE